MPVCQSVLRSVGELGELELQPRAGCDREAWEVVVAVRDDMMMLSSMIRKRETTKTRWSEWTGNEGSTGPSDALHCTALGCGLQGRWMRGKAQEQDGEAKNGRCMGLRK
jgi:hypothetical protein